jgi:hypothetical protein
LRACWGWLWYSQSKANITARERGGRCQRGEKGYDEGSSVDVELHVEGLIERKTSLVEMYLGMAI